MMTTRIKNLLIAVVCLLTAVSAQAQVSFTGYTTQYPTNNYSTTQVKFSLSEVAKGLGTDAATFAADFTSWQDAEAPATNLLFLVDAVTEEPTDAYTCDGKGFYLTSEGARGEWGSTGAWYVYPSIDAENDLFAFNVGQFPDSLKAGDVVGAGFLLNYNSHLAAFAIVLMVDEKPVVNIPDPELKVDKLNIVADLETIVEQKPRSNYNADAVEVDLTDALTKLGIADASVVKDELAQFVYATQYGFDEEDNPLKKDSLSNKSTANGIGFWVRPSVLDENGNFTGECSSADYSSADYFYIQGFAFDDSTGKLTCELGQYPDKVKSGEKWFTYIYIVYGDKAIRVCYTLQVPVIEDYTFEDLTKAGEKAVTVELELSASDYVKKEITIDIEAIAETLGCEVADIEMRALADEVNFGNTTANNGGFWFDIDGFVCGWGGSAMIFIEPPVQDDFSTLNVGQYPDHLQLGEEYTASIYFVAKGKYFKYTVTVKPKEPTVVEGEFQSVAQRTVIFQQEPQTDYVWTSGIDIPVDFVEEWIGTTDYTVYGMALLDENGNEPEGNAKYVKNYTITEAPGFWLNDEGRNSGWNNDRCTFGISAGGYEKGKFNMLQYPNRCNIGDVLQTKLFFVNEETGKMVTFNFIYNIVETIVEYENVGTEDITLPVSADDIVVKIDLSKAAEALGTTVDELVSEDNAYLRGMTINGIYGGAQSCFDGLGFDKYGSFDLSDNMLVFFNITKEGDDVVAATYSNEAVSADFRLSAQFCFQIGNKQYVFYVKFVAAEAYYQGISTVNQATKADGKLYDLSGRSVTKPVSGLYIQNGKKFIVK